MNKGQKLVTSLKTIGYLPAYEIECSSFDWVFENKKLVPFFDLFCDSVEAGNFLSDDENVEFKNIADNVLVGNELDKALSCLHSYSEEHTSECLEEEIQSIIKELASVNCYTNNLIHQRNALNLHETQLCLQITALDELTSVLEKDIHHLESNEVVLDKKMEHCFSTINKTVQNFMTLFNQESYFVNNNVLGESPLHLDLKTYQPSEHLVLEHLKSFIHLQFGYPLSALCNKDSFEESLEEITQSNKDTNFHREIDRIRSALKIAEEMRFKSIVALSQSEGEAEYYRDRIKHELIPCSDLELTYKIEKSKTNLTSAYSEMIELKQCIISKILQWCNQYQNSFILLKNYEEKLQCQEHFLVKQEVVLNNLICQHARQILTLIALGIKRVQLENIHNTLQEFERNVNNDWDSFSGRQIWMHSLKTKDLQDMNNNINYALSILSGNQSTVFYLANTALSNFCQQIQAENSFLLSSLLNITSEQTDQFLTAELDLKTLEQASLVYNSEAQIMHSSFDHRDLICDAVRKLDSNARTLEQSLLSLFKEIEKTKKLIRENSLQLQLRNIFVYFFLKPHKLNEKVSQLQRDIEGEKLLGE